MKEQRLQEILARFDGVTVLVVGDFFLDKYLVIDRALSEVSLETGLEAYQVVEVRCSPGAAGTVTSNLRALEVQVVALGVIGDDGEGYELKRGLRERGVWLDYLLERPDRFTPTYTKPMLREADGREQETNRLDIKNRRPLGPELEEEVIAALREAMPQVDGVVIADQVEEHNCGLITDRVREELSQLAAHYPEKVFIADSRARIGQFRNVLLKPNVREAARALAWEVPPEPDLSFARRCGKELFCRHRKPVFVTVGAQGILLFTETEELHVPAVPVRGEIDIVGAGDSTLAGIVSALCSGATPAEAAVVGNLVASITIQQIGTTGTASREEVLQRFREVGNWVTGRRGN